jgi:hypothetical protein
MRKRKPTKKEKKTGSRRQPRWLVPAFAGGIFLIVVLVAATMFWPQSSEQLLRAEPLPNRGDERLLQDVETFASQGQQHVPQGAGVDYGTLPPTSGPHYSRSIRAGYYTSVQPYGNLVHSLEHGAVVIYYAPDALSSQAEENLRTLARSYRDTWASVVVVPHPEPDPRYPYILTAWTVRLPLEKYDPQTVRAFLAEYLGRGPENRVR